MSILSRAEGMVRGQAESALIDALVSRAETQVLGRTPSLSLCYMAVDQVRRYQEFSQLSQEGQNLLVRRLRESCARVHRGTSQVPGTTASRNALKSRFQQELRATITGNRWHLEEDFYSDCHQRYWSRTYQWVDSWVRQNFPTDLGSNGRTKSDSPFRREWRQEVYDSLGPNPCLGKPRECVVPDLYKVPYRDYATIGVDVWCNITQDSRRQIVRDLKASGAIPANSPEIITNAAARAYNNMGGINWQLAVGQKPPTGQNPQNKTVLLAVAGAVLVAGVLFLRK